VNKLIVVKKPVFISSNSYLKKIKWKYKNKKAGFSGTLDPFACGCLIVAFGQYPKLFKYLKKTPKTYSATIWLDVTSDSLDIENITHHSLNKQLDVNNIKKELSGLVGQLTYLPPKYSAKRIDGKRAYAMARNGENFELKKISSEIFDINFINYNYPFLSFDITVSEGSYIRSIAQILLDRLDTIGTLSYLKRLNEGEFFFENEKELNPIDYLDLPTNKYTGTKLWFELGKKLDINYFENKSDGVYLIVFDTFFSIIEIKNMTLKYILNKVLIDVKS
jgi:tRNA pseudouridine55 synthase